MSRVAATPKGTRAYTAAQEAARDAEEAKELLEQPLKDWQAQMRVLDVIPRHVEDLYDAMNATDKAKVDKFTVDKITAKKTLRLQRPK